MVTIFYRKTVGEVSSQNAGEFVSRDLNTQFDENALTRADICRMYNCISITISHRRQAATTTWVIHRRAIVGHIGDAIFELYENVGASIDA
jgi:hypothetical protein